MKKVLSLILSTALVAGTAQQALAEANAVLKDASQQVAVQSDKGVLPAGSGTTLAYGDRVITGPEGHAVVSFASGKCAGDYQVPAKSLATVSENTCLVIETGARAEADWTAIAVVAGLGVGVGVLAYELSNNKKSQPVSP
ncbi:MAG: hypothetical protein WAN43_18655 [Rhodomicrobium sp.]